MSMATVLKPHEDKLLAMSERICPDCECYGCGVRSEPHKAGYCWLCCAAGVPMPGGYRMAVDNHRRSYRGKRASR